MRELMMLAARRRRAAFGLWLAVASPTVLCAQPGAKSPPVAADRVDAAFVGAVHGALRPASCAGTQHGQQPGSASVASFDETTSAQAPPGSGTFELMIASTCAAPFYQALFAHEAITARFSFVDGATAQTTLTLILANARLTHVDLAQLDVSVGRPVVLKIGIASVQVSTGSTGGSTGTAGAPAAPTGVTAVTPQGGAVSLSAATMKRLRAPSIHMASRVLTTFTPGAGESWASTSTVANAHLITASPALDATFFDQSDLTLSVHATVDAVTGMPTSSFQITLDPLTKAQDAKTAQLKAAALAHAALTQAVVTVIGQSGIAGITLWLKSAHLTADQLSSSNEAITISANQITITDIGSGRTASSP